MSYPSTTNELNTTNVAIPTAEFDENYDNDDDHHSMISYGGGSVFHDDRSVLSAMSNRPNSMYSGKGYLINQNASKNRFGRDTKCMAGSEPGHYLLYRNVHGNRFPIEMYMTKGNPNTTIRHAVSGIREKNMRTGHKDEDAYFKVAYSIGEHGQDRYGSLFYNTPEEYERHFHTTVNQAIKEKWMIRNTEYQKRIMNESLQYTYEMGNETYVTIQ